MSGGSLFEYTYPNFEYADGKWEDMELDELYRDLFINGEFSVRGYGGLTQSLDFYVSGDIGPESYHDALNRFKRKWMYRTPKNRVEYYQGKLQDFAERCKAELAMEYRGEAE